LATTAIKGAVAQNATDTNQVTEGSLTSTDCLAYVYVTWIYFVYSIGLGADQGEYLQVLTQAYALIPSQCGGYFTSSPALPPTTVLSLLISTTTTTTTTEAPNSIFNIFPSLFRGGLSSLDTRDKLVRAKKTKKNRNSIFREGMEKMAGQPLTKYIAELGAGPLFKANGKIELGLGKIKGRRGRQFCRDISKSFKEVRQICRKIRQNRNKGVKEQRKQKIRKGKNRGITRKRNKGKKV